MSDIKSPAFQFYPAEFLADENVLLMSNQEIGCYVKLMCVCWRQGSIPSDINKIAKLCSENGSAMAQLWTAIKPCFNLDEKNPLRLIHPRLEKEKAKQKEFKIERSSSGKRGADSRWNKGPLKNNGSAIGSANGSATDQPLAKNGSLSSSSSTKEKKEKKDEKKKAKKNRTACPVDFTPDENHRTLAHQYTLDVVIEFAKFQDRNQATGQTYADWPAAFRNWLRKAYEFKNLQLQKQNGSTNYAKPKTATQRLLERYNAELEPANSERIINPTGDAAQNYSASASSVFGDLFEQVE